MNFEEVITWLVDDDMRNEFITRLKNAGKKSKPFLNLQSAMTQLKMHKTPRGIHQKTIIQHTLRFSDVDDCFRRFRLVCKSWKDAVETIRFNQFVGFFFFHVSDFKIDDGILPNANYLSKYLKLFRKLWMPLDLENKTKIFSWVLNNMKKLNEILFSREDAMLSEEYDSFALQMLQNSHKTLRVLKLPKFVIPDVDFPQLTKLDLTIDENDNSFQEFQTYFPQALNNMENLEIIELDLSSIVAGYYHIGEYIGKNYPKHCISSSDTETLSVMPVKILEQIEGVRLLDNEYYISHLQYAHVYILNPEQPISDDWNRYREIFDQCINLKAIEFDGMVDGLSTGNFITDILPKMPEANQEIWNERISYFQARNIRLANQNEILNNENLRKKLAKEAGVTWRFNFYYGSTHPRFEF